MDNNYSKLLSILKKDSGNSGGDIRIGTIVSVGPLTVKMGELQLGKEFLYIDKQLKTVIKNGDMVAIASINSGQKFIVFSILEGG